MPQVPGTHLVAWGWGEWFFSRRPSRELYRLLEDVVQAILDVESDTLRFLELFRQPAALFVVRCSADSHERAATQPFLACAYLFLDFLQCLDEPSFLIPEMLGVSRACCATNIDP